MKKFFTILALIMVCIMLLPACGASATPLPGADESSPLEELAPGINPQDFVVPPDGTFVVDSVVCSGEYFGLSLSYSPVDLQFNYILNPNPGGSPENRFPSCSVIENGHFSCSDYLYRGTDGMVHLNPYRQAAPGSPDPSNDQRLFPGWVIDPASLPNCLPDPLPTRFARMNSGVECIDASTIQFYLDMGLPIGYGGSISFVPADSAAPIRYGCYTTSTPRRLRCIGPRPLSKGRLEIRLEVGELAEDPSGVIFESVDNFSSQVENCVTAGKGAQPPAPTETPPTFIINCPSYDKGTCGNMPGCFWWFSNGTCSNIPEPTPQPQLTCADYKDYDSCKQAGCSWWMNGSCHDPAAPDPLCSTYTKESACNGVIGCGWDAKTMTCVYQ